MLVIPKLRKLHRYLGILIGIQFLAWTVSGRYFSWTDIDDIHGDPQMRHPRESGQEGRNLGRHPPKGRENIL